MIHDRSPPVCTFVHCVGDATPRSLRTRQIQISKLKKSAKFLKSVEGYVYTVGKKLRSLRA